MREIGSQKYHNMLGIHVQIPTCKLIGKKEGRNAKRQYFLGYPRRASRISGSLHNLYAKNSEERCWAQPMLCFSQHLTFQIVNWYSNMQRGMMWQRTGFIKPPISQATNATSSYGRSREVQCVSTGKTLLLSEEWGTEERGMNSLLGFPITYILVLLIWKGWNVGLHWGRKSFPPIFWQKTIYTFSPGTFSNWEKKE